MRTTQIKRAEAWRDGNLIIHKALTNIAPKDGLELWTASAPAKRRQWKQTRRLASSDCEPFSRAIGDSRVPAPPPLRLSRKRRFRRRESGVVSCRMTVPDPSAGLLAWPALPALPRRVMLPV
ncbi:hypothetical protein AAFF_G00239440 [Aldrovandia affinis]|uniref:Uncharacterized protein n=1 Tax=Aldrovandia affinis TaxID=143900 RepID=A0AAD7REN4_9TELE|nr:hypothetical protein AAFF_G00239440 [Aldrovandia affinis]